MSTIITPDTHTLLPPKFLKTAQWSGYPNPRWEKKDKHKVTVLFSFVERRKSLFLGAFFKRRGYKYIDLGDHVKEDVRWGKEYGNRMECNPMYFTSGALIRNLFKLMHETGLSKHEIAEKYIFLGGGGQCGPCRYGMYPQEYLKVVNDAGFKGFRILIFSSDITPDPQTIGSALPLKLAFKIHAALGVIFADLLHIAECALRPYAADKAAAMETIRTCENIIFNAFSSKLYPVKLIFALKKAGKLLAAVRRVPRNLPRIFVTGEFFANLAHNDGNYNLRRFIMDEGCEVYPGSFTQRILYDNWRRMTEAKRGITYAGSKTELKKWKSFRRRQGYSSSMVRWFYKKTVSLMRPELWGGRTAILDLDEMARIGGDFYHPEIFGGESNLEVAEAIHYADEADGFISSKPFGCMPSSGVSDGVQAKIMSMYPGLNFLSIETSGDNEVSILSRVSMLIFKAREKAAKRFSNA